MEAERALLGGADVIDVKEPANGPLGRAGRRVLHEVAREVGGRRLVSAAAGEMLRLATDELLRWNHDSPASLVKFGPAGLDADRWPGEWRRLAERLTPGQQPVAVAYADWRTAESPPPTQVLALAAEAGCRWLLVDTFDKRSGGLFDACEVSEAAELVQRCVSGGVQLVLAGRLRAADLATAARLGPRLVGVRSAVCAGGRRGVVQRGLVERACAELARIADRLSPAAAEKI